VVKKILIGLVVVLVVCAAVVALQPSDFRIVRSIRVSAPVAEVFSQVNDFHNWQAWSPWAKLDPAAKNSFEGPSAGAGAGFTWDGNGQVGAGRMTLIESRPSDLIRIKLEFERPFKDTSAAEFTFKPEGDQTLVTWSMSGRKNFMSKAFCLFMNMDKMVGGEFEKGLAEMKSIAEAEARQQGPSPEPEPKGG
jgi:uncharacterized protein YndB with AHSA1/START domain